MEAIGENHGELMDLWHWSLQKVKDPEMKGRIIGTKSSMNIFSFLFGCLLGKTLLKQTDNLSRTLQNPTLSAAEEQEIAQDVIMTMEKDCNDKSFDLFWERLEEVKEKSYHSTSQTAKKAPNA